MFVDEVRIFVQAGSGGQGSVAFRREKFVPNGGPAGGDGGRGGDIIFVAESGLTTLMDFRHQRHFKAQNGDAGGNNNRHGADADDVVVRVPIGTVVTDDEGRLLADLVEPGATAVVARGGRGGKGNTHFVSSVHRTPRIAEGGQPGEQRWVNLELNLLADVGLVGFPNAGKSTLISVVSKARPKIADYPFTTLVPNLGVVTRYGDDKPFIIADVPGLIEGAHLGAGLGDTFLRHLKRTRVLIHLVDLTPMEGRDPVTDYRIIEHELAAFSPELAERPVIVVGNKTDVPDTSQSLERLKEALAPREVFSMSAATGEGVDTVMWKVQELLQAIPVPDKTPRQIVTPTIRGFHLEPKDGGVRIVGDVEERAAMTLWGRPEAEEYFCEYLRRRGVPQALKRANIEDDAYVYVGEGVFRWREHELVVD